MLHNNNAERDPANTRHIAHSQCGFAQEVENHRTYVLPYLSRSGSRGLSNVGEKQGHESI